MTVLFAYFTATVKGIPVLAISLPLLNVRLLLLAPQHLYWTEALAYQERLPE